MKGAEDAYLIKYNSAGNKQWTKLSGVSAPPGQPSLYTKGVGVGTDVSGNIFVTGYTTGNLRPF